MNMNNKGFTLIELIATIALLAIIAIISFVSINGVINQNKVNNCESLIMNIKTAAKEYVSDNRYNANFDADNDKIERIDVKSLVDNHYLSDEIVYPFDNSKNVDGDKIEIKIELKDDYSAGSIFIYKNDIIDENVYNCDKVNDSDKYDCNKDWWEAVLK